jgi:aarF domain-containing kinase
MDYKLEGQNAYLLGRDMSSLSGIKVATVVSELSTTDVLTTEWVAGEKLSDSRASDVRELCTTLLNAYLIQLLETGLLHADPHPGNLIR